MFARKFISDGRIVCPRPWRARKATLLPSSSPIMKASYGSPNGVLREISSDFLKPGML